MSVKVKDFQRPILFGNFLSSSFNFVFFLLASLLLSIEGISVTDISVILGGANLAAALAQPLIGRLADTGKLTPIALGAFVANAIGIYSLAATNLPILVMGSSLILISASVIQTISSRSLEGLSEPENQADIASLNYMLSNIGYAISAVLAFFFIESNKQMLLILDIATTGIACFLIATYGGLMTTGHTQPTLNALRRSDAEQNWLRALMIKPVFFALFATIPIFMCLASSFSIIQVVFAERGLDYSKFSTIVIGVSSLSVVAGYYFLRAMKPNNVIKIILGGVFLGFGVTLLSLTTTIESCLLYSSIWAFGEILIIGDASAIFFKVVPRSYPGLAAGLKIAALRIAFVICPLLILLLGKLNEVKITLALAIPCLIGAIVLYRLKLRSENLT